jgi:hypothetical protein
MFENKAILIVTLTIAVAKSHLLSIGNRAGSVTAQQKWYRCLDVGEATFGERPIANGQPTTQFVVHHVLAHPQYIQQLQ